MIAKMLINFEVKVTSFSRSGKDGAHNFDHFDRLLPTFDVIILIVPLNDQTRHLMNAQRLAAMKNGAALINVARGPVVDTDALIAELNSGRITAGLDVTDPEPLPSDHPLWKARNVIITPHVGGDSEAFTPRGRKLVEEQLARYAKNPGKTRVLQRRGQEPNNPQIPRGTRTSTPRATRNTTRADFIV